MLAKMFYFLFGDVSIDTTYFPLNPCNTDMTTKCGAQYMFHEYYNCIL